MVAKSFQSHGTEVTEEKALKKALGLMISLLIPHRGINVCSAFDKKSRVLTLSLLTNSEHRAAEPWKEDWKKRLLETLSGIPHVFPEDMTEASPKMEPTDGDIETSFGCYVLT